MTVVQSRFDRQANELYETPAWVTRALLRHFPMQGSVWEPAAGNHAMVAVLREAGARVVTSDVQRYGCGHDFIFDFLDERASGTGCDSIITNPPYGKGNRLAAKFCRLALQRCDGFSGFVAMLCTAKFDFGSTRADLFADNHRFAGKIALVDRIQWFAGEYQGTEDHAWYVWGAPDLCRSPRLYYAGNDEK